MTTKKTALLLVNVGTPDSPDKRSVRRYLREFLNDKRVIDLPWLFRKILVNLVIIPFRVPKSTSLYKRLWTEQGSPLLVYADSIVKKVQGLSKEKVNIYYAMRYGKPSLTSVLDSILKSKYEEIVVLPLYPQFADSTTGSVNEIVNAFKPRSGNAAIKTIDQFWSHPAFIESFVTGIKKHPLHEYDHVVFSYHGLPLRQINKIHKEHDSRRCICDSEMPPWGHHCYKAACYGTTRLLTAKLGLEEGQYSTSFQSRLNRNWLSPFTDETLMKLASEGKNKVLVVAPSFVTDCLETIVEIGQDYKKLFLEHGGSELTLVESLNDSSSWADAILKISKLQAVDY
ncbi:MAG: ferrochelatase [Bacteroidales bacterium]|nr:ferrochelatase [Bacteroidales bacterium]